MKNKHIASKIYTTLVMLFLYLPIFVLIIFSFNEGKTTVWKGFSFKWYEELFRDDKIIKRSRQFAYNCRTRINFRNRTRHCRSYRNKQFQKVKKDCLYKVRLTFRLSVLTL